MHGKLNITDIVNIDDYPVSDKNDPARAALINRCRADLKEKLYCAIPDFIRPAALKAMAEEAQSLRSQAFDNNSNRNCYLQRQIDSSLPNEHARNHLESTSTRMIAYDQMPDSSPLKAFYHADSVRSE
jgi:hypothetical protein